MTLPLFSFILPFIGILVGFFITLLPYLVVFALVAGIFDAIFGDSKPDRTYFDDDDDYPVDNSSYKKRNNNNHEDYYKKYYDDDYY